MNEETKQVIINQLVAQWFKDNPGLEEDILDLAGKVVLFNTKWGTKLDVTDIFKETA